MMRMRVMYSFSHIWFIFRSSVHRCLCAYGQLHWKSVKSQLQGLEIQAWKALMSADRCTSSQVMPIFVIMYLQGCSLVKFPAQRGRIEHASIVLAPYYCPKRIKWVLSPTSNSNSYSFCQNITGFINFSQYTALENKQPVFPMLIQKNASILVCVNECIDKSTGPASSTVQCLQI